MKFKLSDVYNLVRSLPKITDKELPIKTSYKLLRLLKSCSEEMETLEKSRIKIVEKYSEKPDEAGNFKVKDENKDKFTEEFTKLLEEEVEIEFTKIEISELGNISFSVNDLAPLDKIIKEK